MRVPIAERQRTVADSSEATTTACISYSYSHKRVAYMHRRNRSHLKYLRLPKFQVATLLWLYEYDMHAVVVASEISATVRCLSAICCNTLHTATHCCTNAVLFASPICNSALFFCNTLQHTATHCNTLQHTATHCNTLTAHCDVLQQMCRVVTSHPSATERRVFATHCNTLQHTATHSLHTATHCNRCAMFWLHTHWQQSAVFSQRPVTHCVTLQHTTHYTPQHNATHVPCCSVMPICNRTLCVRLCIRV